MFVAVEVDDLIITGDDEDGKEELRTVLTDRFGKTDEDGKRYIDWESPVASFMGIRIDYNRKAGVMRLDIEKKIDALFVDFPYLSGWFTAVHATDVPP